ncbi:MAG: hypothetical protein ACREIC_25225, partial [Limisphaerales bacterium]
MNRWFFPVRPETGAQTRNERRSPSAPATTRSQGGHNPLRRFGWSGFLRAALVVVCVSAFPLRAP